MAVKRLSSAERTKILDAVINQAAKDGYKVTELRTTTATLRRGKRFNWVVFIIGSILTAGLFVFIYPVYFLLFARGEILEINIDAAGNVQGTRRKV